MSRQTTIHKVLFYLNTVILLLFGVVFFFNYYNTAKNIQVYNNGPVWTVFLPNGDVYDNVDVDANELHYSLNPGERILLQTELDSSYHGAMTARIFTRESGMQVYMNDDEIFRYKATTQEYAGSGYHFVSIPLSYSQRTFEVEIIGEKVRPSDSMPEIVITSSKDAYALFLDEHIFTIFCAIFLLVFGVILTLFSIVSYAIDSEYYLLLLTGIIGTFSGLWSVASTKAVELLSMNIGLNTFVEYGSLYILPVPILLFIAKQHEADGRSSRTIRVASGMMATFAILAVVLHVSGIAYVSELLHLYHALVAVALVLVAISGLKRVRRMEKYEVFYLLAFVTAIGYIAFYIGRFQYLRLAGRPTYFHSFQNMIFGLLLFELFLFVGYLSYMNTRIVSRAEHEVLENLAYKDAMTGLCNRARGERMMQDLNARKDNRPFAIINFDLNGLKRTNDSLGHFAGDDMLKKFAQILSKVFDPIGTPVRMSGDEFIVIVEGSDNIRHIDLALDQMEQMEREVSEQAEYVLDASYGVARSVEFLQPKAEQVYLAADHRMYDMKEASKKGRE